MPGRPTNLDYSRAGPIVLAVGAGGGCLDIFSLIYHFSFLSPSLWETARYRLKYCLKWPLSPKQPTNQPTNHTDQVLFGDDLDWLCACIYEVSNVWGSWKARYRGILGN